MTIRNILLALTSFLSSALFASVVTQIWSTKLDYDEAQQLVALEEVRADLLVADRQFSEETTRTYFLLKQGEAPTRVASELGDIRASVDLSIAAASRLFGVQLLQNIGAAQVEKLQTIRNQIAMLRERLSAYAADDQPTDSALIAWTWLQESGAVSSNLRTLRRTLLEESRTLNPVANAQAELRLYTSLLSEHLQQNRALIGGALIENALSADVLDEINLNTGRADLIWQLARGELPDITDREIIKKLDDAQGEYSRTYVPLQSITIERLQRQIEPPRRADGWMLTTRNTILRIDDLQTTLLAESRALHLDILSHSRRTLLIWITLAVAGLLAAAASVVVVRDLVVRPIDRIKETMLRLADNDLDVSVPRARRHDEIASMINALRKFKANAIWRGRLNAQLHALHEELDKAHSRLRSDLEAAAAIQKSLLPGSGRCGPFSFCGLYRASSLVAGDTQNIVCRPDDRIVFFQIDVAGHGAPAALCSMAVHHALSDIARTHAALDNPVQVITDLNRRWPDNLPYFTVCLGQIDTKTGDGVLVQAGHPAPLLLKANRDIEQIGCGGIPVGIIAEPEYEALRFRIRSGELLLLYTDGLVEAADRTGKLFGEDRLMHVVSAHKDDPASCIIDSIERAVSNWRKTDSLDDDMTVLLIKNEGTHENEH